MFTSFDNLKFAARAARAAGFARKAERDVFLETFHIDSMLHVMM